MLIVVSPAKSLNFDLIDQPNITKPRFIKETKELVGVMKDKKRSDLKKLMDVSDKIADLNVERFNSFKFPFNTKNAKPSVFAFTGDVYRGLDVSQFSSEDIEYAQKHFRILSGLYGLLRPLDLIQPYRLEMGTKLALQEFRNLYQYWGDKIVKAINRDMKQNGDQYLVNLASEEYFKSINKSLLKAPLVQIHFKEYRDDTIKIISFSAKKARGMMSRFIIKNRIEQLGDLKAFHEDNYLYNEELSSELELVFTR